MRRNAVRWAVAVLLTILAGMFPVAGIAFAVQNGQNNHQAWVNTIDSRDREFLTVIRFANLWEMPMGKLATERGTTQEVKTAGATMLADHTRLNTVVEDLAQRFGMSLPDKPKASQLSWMAEISSKRGQDFDHTFVDRVRAAHGTVFSTIAEVRAGTRNRTILDFATQANSIVLKHMTLLEKTGYVTDDGHFAEAGARTPTNPENALSSSDLFLGAVVVVLMGGATIFVVRTLSAG